MTCYQWDRGGKNLGSWGASWFHVFENLQKGSRTVVMRRTVWSVEREKVYKRTTLIRVGDVKRVKKKCSTEGACC